jgi:ATP-dependent RNA helicase DeaD
MHKHPTLPSAFAELGLSTPILIALGKAGFQEPTDIQKAVIPLVLQGRDVMGQARTGTGKTAAFGLPILQMVSPDKRLQALILVPTRELAVQVAAEIRRLSEADLHVVPVYGGQKIKHQLHLLGRKPHIVVGTPGRVMDFLDRKVLRLDDISIAVLDEVDRMLDIGFRDDIKTILSQIRHAHQTVFVSATLNDDIKRLARQYTTDPIEVNVSRDEITVDEIHQSYLTVDPWDKFRLLTQVLKREDPKLAIIFCNTKHSARKLAHRLHEAGQDAKEIHGDLVQQKREKIMDRFRRHNIRLLVATDLAARGIDVHGITHIINYDIPPDPHVYVHRIGRTARMGNFGKAITLVTREEGKQLTEVEMLINKQVVADQVEGFQASPPPDRFRGGPGPGRGRAAAPAGAVATTTASPPVSRYSQSAFAEGVGPADTGSQTVTKPKRLGAKFKPARRRRR